MVGGSIIEKCHYTYTPTEQNKATMPKPPSALANRATAGSFRDSLFVGRLLNDHQQVVWVEVESNIRGEIEGKAKRGE